MEMHRLAIIIQNANKNHSPLPSKKDIWERIHSRIATLENSSIEAGIESEELLISEEIRRLRELLDILKPTLDMIRAYIKLETELKAVKEEVESDIRGGRLIPTKVLQRYNVALYHYNEFCNIVESLI